MELSEIIIVNIFLTYIKNYILLCGHFIQSVEGLLLGKKNILMSDVVGLFKAICGIFFLILDLIIKKNNKLPHRRTKTKTKSTYKMAKVSGC